MVFYRTYNLSKLNKDIQKEENKTIVVLDSPDLEIPLRRINLSKISLQDHDWLPEFKFFHIGLKNHQTFYYYEEIAAPISQTLSAPELILKIKFFLDQHKVFFAKGHFYFHGSALVSLIIKHIYNQEYVYADINILAKTNKEPVTQNNYEPRSKLAESKSVQLGAGNRNQLSVEYSTGGSDLNLESFFKGQPFNYDEVIFDIQKNSLHYSPNFIDFIESLTIHIKPNSISINTFLHAHRLASLWGCKFYYKDYLPFFVESLPEVGKIGECSVADMAGPGNGFELDPFSAPKLKFKNIDFYNKNVSFSWLTFAEVDDYVFNIDFSHPDFNIPIASLTPEYRRCFKQAVSKLYTEYHLSYLTIPASFFTKYYAYLSISSFDWTIRDPAFIQKFIFQWKNIPISVNEPALKNLFKTHSEIKNKFFEMAHYHGMVRTWDFFNCLLKTLTKDHKKGLRFIGYLENHLSISIHNLPENYNLFYFLYNEFCNSFRSKHDRFLIFPIQLPWYLKKLVTELKTSGELEEESNFMNHCVAGYDVKVENNKCRIFHLETGMGHSTLELDSNFNITQHQGYANNIPRIKNVMLANLLSRYLKKNLIQKNKKIVDIYSLLL